MKQLREEKLVKIMYILEVQLLLLGVKEWNKEVQMNLTEQHLI